jgi:hypothetical protein
MINGFVAISNNVVQAIVTGPLYDRSPVAIYGISKVLMPVELPLLLNTKNTSLNYCCFAKINIYILEGMMYYLLLFKTIS